MCAGMLCTWSDHPEAVPICLLKETVLVRDVEPGEVVRFEHVALGGHGGFAALPQDQAIGGGEAHDAVKEFLLPWVWPIFSDSTPLQLLSLV